MQFAIVVFLSAYDVYPTSICLEFIQINWKWCLHFQCLNSITVFFFYYCHYSCSGALLHFNNVAARLHHQSTTLLLAVKFQTFQNISSLQNVMEKQWNCYGQIIIIEVPVLAQQSCYITWVTVVNYWIIDFLPTLEVLLKVMPLNVNHLLPAVRLRQAFYHADHSKDKHTHFHNTVISHTWLYLQPLVNKFSSNWRSNEAWNDNLLQCLLVDAAKHPNLSTTGLVCKSVCAQNYGCMPFLSITFWCTFIHYLFITFITFIQQTVGQLY